MSTDPRLDRFLRNYTRTTISDACEETRPKRESDQRPDRRFDDRQNDGAKTPNERPNMVVWLRMKGGWQMLPPDTVATLWDATRRRPDTSLCRLLLKDVFQLTPLQYDSVRKSLDKKAGPGVQGIYKAHDTKRGYALVIELPGDSTFNAKTLAGGAAIAALMAAGGYGLYRGSYSNEKGQEKDASDQAEQAEEIRKLKAKVFQLEQVPAPNPVQAVEDISVLREELRLAQERESEHKQQLERNSATLQELRTQVQSYEGQLATNNDQLAAAAKVELAQCNERADNASATVVATEAELAKCNQRAVASEAALVASKAALAESNQRADSAESELTESKQSENAAAAQLAECNQRAGSAESALAQSQRRAEAANAALVQSKQRAVDVEATAKAQLDICNQRADSAESELAESKQREHAAETELVQSKKREDAVAEQRDELIEELRGLYKTVQESQTEILVLRQELVHYKPVLPQQIQRTTYDENEKTITIQEVYDQQKRQIIARVGMGAANGVEHLIFEHAAGPLSDMLARWCIKSKELLRIVKTITFLNRSGPIQMQDVGDVFFARAKDVFFINADIYVKDVLIDWRSEDQKRFLATNYATLRSCKFQFKIKNLFIRFDTRQKDEYGEDFIPQWVDCADNIRVVIDQYQLRPYNERSFDYWFFFTGKPTDILFDINPVPTGNEFSDLLQKALRPPIQDVYFPMNWDITLKHMDVLNNLLPDNLDIFDRVHKGEQPLRELNLPAKSLLAGFAQKLSLFK